jgi:hypothetical protein
MTIQYGQVKSFFDSDYIRVLENGTDIRITESSDTRITGLTAVNMSVSSLSAKGTKKGILRDAYIKFSSIWRSTEPYVKHEGVWKEPFAIYIKQSGVWTRVY